MAVLGSKFSMVDAAKRIDQTGKYVQIAEILNQSNPILQDMPFFPSNAPRGNRVTFRTSLPEVQWSRINRGVKTSRTNVTAREDTIGVLEGRSEVDRRHKGRTLNDDAYRAFRYDEDQTYLESMSQRMAETLLLGNEEFDSEAFTGFFPRLSNVDDPIFGKSITKAETKTSSREYENILIVDWGQRYCHGIYPLNTPAGIRMEDHPNQETSDADGGKYYVDVSTFEWALGLTVRHPKHVHRICNLPKGPLDAIVSSGSATLNPASTTGSAVATAALYDIPGMLIRAMNAMDQCLSGSRVIYCSQAMLTAIELLAKNTNNLTFGTTEWAGQPVTTFRGVPLRKLDVLDTFTDNGI